MNSNQHKISMEHRDFWDSLQTDMRIANQNISQEDYNAFLERSFMFSLFFRDCSALEINGYQSILGLKDNAYVILLNLLEPGKSNISNITIDEFRLHQSIKDRLKHKNCVLGPILTRRMILLVSSDTLLSEAAQREESLEICMELSHLLEQEYSLRLVAAIGAQHSIYSIYPSFTDALYSLYNCGSEAYSFYLDNRHNEINSDFDYIVTENHLLESVRLRKADAYDYFGLLMNWLKPFHDVAKRSKILELLVLTHHAITVDSVDDVKSIDIMGIVADLMKCSGDQLIDYGYRLFIYITSYAKQQHSIDYSNHIVKATKEYLEIHYADDISLEDMAEHVNISPQYFSKLIKKTTGFNFIDWLSMLRVKKAKELLTNSNLTVKEVCFMVGYKDPNYFSRIFKKRIGITPSEYVKANSYLSNKN